MRWPRRAASGLRLSKPWLSLAALALAGCSLLPAGPEPASFPLLPPQTLGRSVERQQILRIAYAATGATFQCVVRATPADITVIGLLPLGPRAFSLSWDGVQLKSESAMKNEQAPRPGQMLADLELAFWPLAALQSAAGKDWSVTEPQPNVRRLVHQGRLYAEVRRDGGGDAWDGHLWLVNFAQGYSLDIDSRPAAN